MFKRVTICGVPFSKVTYESAMSAVDLLMQNECKSYITTPNPEMLLSATEDEKFLEVLRGASINIPDGIGILWAATYLNKPKVKWRFLEPLQLYSSLAGITLYPPSVCKVLPYRVTGVDLFERIIDRSQDREWKIFLLGAQQGVAERCKRNMKKKYPNARFVGTYAGSPDSDEEDAICERINQSAPDILFVAYGSPAQEFWIHRNLFKLDSVRLAIGLGGAFDFASGTAKRAPKWLQKLGLEWLWRLLHQPARHKRIKNATKGFIKLIREQKN